MFDTNIVIVGNVLTAPEWRRTTKTDKLVANFRVASTSRRFDRDNNRWVDGDTLRVRVSCWRRLAENVSASIAVGDPVVVVGRLYTRDWTDSENNPRISYEMEAVAVGHDLARGRTRLYRNKPLAVSGAADGPGTDAVVAGEHAELVSEVPAGYGEGIPDDDEPPVFHQHPVPAYDPVAALAGGGIESFDNGATPPGEAASERPDSDLPDELEGIELRVEALTEPTTPRRPRRGVKREPVPA
ncbi:MAG TPA: single-stranded DNA-binding protein [Actinoplanes sp.]|nr:single-stranded DNA-binding protein [Actinoplanes sp.]